MALQYTNLCDYCGRRLEHGAGSKETAHGLLRYGSPRTVAPYSGGNATEINQLMLNDGNGGRGLATLFAQDLCLACACHLLKQIMEAAERELARIVKPEMERVAQPRAIRISDDGELGHNV